jgi:ElaB/YqjD/DUF883 family membrane-anchored ribosome-binding protein
MDTTRELELPSGWEVETASLRLPMESVSSSGVAPLERSGFRGKLDTWKSRGLSKVHDIQQVVSDRKSAAKTSLITAKSSVRDGAKSQVAKVQTSMRTNPGLWAGVAAGAGFGIGLIGRFAQWRSKQRHRMPDLIIIESTC